MIEPRGGGGTVAVNARQRRTLIEERVIRDGEIAFVDLAEEFHVSEMTIRRDVEVLQSRGVVRRVSGGAIALNGTAFEPSYDLRAGQSTESKAHIAARVADLLRPGETVVLDSGSTVHAVAKALRGRDLGLTVLTPSIAVAVELADEPRTHVILTGGSVRPGELSLIGSDAEAAFARYNCDTFVMGVAGVDPVRGLTEYHPQEASVKRAAIRASARVLVGADSTKVGRVHLVNLAPLSALTALVTDCGRDHPVVVTAESIGVDVVCVPPRPSLATTTGEPA